MKKILLLLAITLTTLVGCSSKEDVEFGTEYSVNDKLTFEIIETGIINQIAPTKKTSLYTYYKPQSKDNDMLNITFKMTNVSKDVINIAEVCEGEIDFGESKNELNFLGESAELNTVTTDVKIAPSDTHFIHIYCEIPKDSKEKEATLKMTLLDEKYDFTFSLEKANLKSEEKKLGDTIETDTLSIKLNKINKSKRLEPSDKSSNYTYYDVKNSDETFLVLEATIKNKTDEEIPLSKTLFESIHMSDGTEAAGVIYKESENKRNLPEARTLDAKKTTECFMAVSIKDELIDENGYIKLFIDDSFYTIIL